MYYNIVIKENCMKKLIKTESAITLIALVITIIVLLILSAVTILSITGNDNAMGKAVEAKNSKNESEAKEQAISIITAWTGEYYEYKYVQRTSEENINNFSEYVVAKKLANDYKVDNYTLKALDNGKIQISSSSGKGTFFIDPEKEIIIDWSWNNGSDTVSVAEAEIENTLNTNGEIEIEKGKKLAIKITNLSDLESFSYSSENETFVKVSENGILEGINAGGPIQIILQGKTGQKILKVTVKNTENIIGDLVEYNVGYQDLSQNGAFYNASNGWRILDEGTYEYDATSDSDTYRNAKIVSTTNPLVLLFNDSENNNQWMDNTESTLGGKIQNGLSIPSNLQRMTLQNIAVYKEPAKNNQTYNCGFYNKIVHYNNGNEENQEVSESQNIINLFGLNSQYTVRILNIQDLNTALEKESTSRYERRTSANKSINDALDIKSGEDPKGLFDFRTYLNVNTDFSYFLATKGTNAGQIWKISKTGVFSQQAGFGRMRVVVELNNTKIKKDQGIWKIVE